MNEHPIARETTHQLARRTVFSFILTFVLPGFVCFPSIRMAGKKDIRLMALEDPDLEPLWCQISEI
jgi:hypothetical protein